MEDQLFATNQETHSSTNQNALLHVFLCTFAESFARLEEQTREELLQDIQVSLGSMQVRSDETRTRLEGLHRALTVLVEQAVRFQSS